MSRVKWVVKAVAAGSKDAEQADQFPTNLLLVDSATPGSGRTFDWSLVARIVTESRIILSGGLTEQNVGDAIARVRPWGVDVSTGVEREPGVKDPLKVKRFIDAVRRADAAVS
jgi:phosphoribosylanthranilate isomerase